MKARYAFFLLLFGWISFAPYPVHLQYKFIAWLLLCGGALWFHAAVRLKRDWPLWCFVAAAVSGVVGSHQPAAAAQVYLELAVPAALLYYIGVGALRSKADGIAWGVTVSVCAAAVVAFGLVEFASGKNFLYDYLVPNLYYTRFTAGVPRMISTQFNPAVLGAYCLWCVFIVFALRRMVRPGMKPLVLGVGVLLLGGIMLSASRGVFVGLLAATLVYAGLRYGRKQALVCLLVMASALAWFSAREDAVTSRFGMFRLVAGSSDSMFSSYRADRLQLTEAMLLESKGVGIGYTGFRSRFKEFADRLRVPSNIPYEYRIPDNMYFALLSEAGVLGCGGLLVFCFVMLRRGMRAVRRLGAGWQQELLIGALASLVGLLVNMAAFDLFYWYNPYMLFCLATGLIAGLSAHET